MSFRYEYKYFINPNRKLEFYNWLNENDFKKNYPDRIINSIYFDNNSLSMFLDSEEGLVPRKKIRIRWYGGLNNLILSDANFEEKTSLLWQYRSRNLTLFLEVQLYLSFPNLVASRIP